MWIRGLEVLLRNHKGKRFGYLAKPSPIQLDRWKPSPISCKTLPNKKKVHYFTMESGQTSVNLIEKYGTDKLDQVIVYTQKELTCFVKDHAFNSHISVKVKSQRKTVIYNCTSCDWKAVYTHEIPSKSRSKEQCKYYYSKTWNCEHSTLCSSQLNPTKAQMMKNSWMCYRHKYVIYPSIMACSCQVQLHADET